MTSNPSLHRGFQLYFLTSLQADIKLQQFAMYHVSHEQQRSIHPHRTQHNCASLSAPRQFKALTCPAAYKPKRTQKTEQVQPSWKISWKDHLCKHTCHQTRVHICATSVSNFQSIIVWVLTMQVEVQGNFNSESLEEVCSQS